MGKKIIQIPIVQNAKNIRWAELGSVETTWFSQRAMNELKNDDEVQLVCADTAVLKVGECAITYDQQGNLLLVTNWAKKSQ